MLHDPTAYAVQSFLKYLLLLSLTLFAFVPSRSQVKTVVVVTIEGAITPPTAEYVHQEIAAAAASGAECLVVQLNTPGGLLASTALS